MGFTPFGPIPLRCIHSVANEAYIKDLPNGKTLVIEPSNSSWILPDCEWDKMRIGDYDGWMAYASSNIETTYDSFVGKFSVPDKPINTPNAIFLFISLQDVNWIPFEPEPQIFDSIKSVLQYPGDNGLYWSVKSWYFTLDKGFVMSSEVQVEVGDIIEGNMTRISGDTWYIGVHASGNTTMSSIYINRNRLLFQPFAYVTLEGYGVNGCSSEPHTPSRFTDLQLYHSNSPVIANWTSYASDNPQCSERAVVYSPSNINICFQNTSCN